LSIHAILCNPRLNNKSRAGLSKQPIPLVISTLGEICPAFALQQIPRTLGKTTLFNTTSKHHPMSTLSIDQKETMIELQQNNCSNKQLRKIIENYFRYYTAKGIKDELWMLTVAILSSDHAPEAETGNHRNSRLHFYEHSLLFIEAVNQLYQQQKKKKAKRKNKIITLAQPPAGRKAAAGISSRLTALPALSIAYCPLPIDHC
jgi:hypothetical protein